MIAFYIKAFLQNAHSFTHSFIHSFLHGYRVFIKYLWSFYQRHTSGVENMECALLFALSQRMSQCSVDCEMLGRCEEMEDSLRIGSAGALTGPQLFGLLALVNFCLSESLLPPWVFIFPSNYIVFSSVLSPSTHL